jgi:cytoskeletal protein RodZ
MIKESLGDQLRKAREERGIDIKSISKETNIAPKYIEALENNDYDKFPSETYLLGFLRSYGNYLNIDDEKLLQHYRAEQISESQPPLEELTRPTGGMKFKFSWNREKTFLLAKGLASLAVMGMVVYGLYLGLEALQSNSGITPHNKEQKEISRKPDSREKTQKIEFTRQRAETLLKKKELVTFQVENREYGIRLLQIRKTQNQALIEILPIKKEMVLSVRQKATLPLKNLGYNLIFLLKAQTAHTAKIELRRQKVQTSGSQGQKTQAHTTKPDELTLKMHIQLSDNSYIETYTDGKKVYAGLMHNGKEAYWTAQKTIQIHMGNADGVHIKVNGKKFHFDGKVVNKTFYWQQDPLDPSQYKVNVKSNF